MGGLTADPVGTAVALTPLGLLLTAAHVVEESPTLHVVFESHRSARDAGRQARRRYTRTIQSPIHRAPSSMSRSRSSVRSCDRSDDAPSKRSKRPEPPTQFCPAPLIERDTGSPWTEASSEPRSALGWASNCPSCKRRWGRRDPTRGRGSGGGSPRHAGDVVEGARRHPLCDATNERADIPTVRSEPRVRVGSSQRLEISSREGARIVSYFWSSLTPGSPYVDERTRPARRDAHGGKFGRGETRCRCRRGRRRRPGSRRRRSHLGIGRRHAVAPAVVDAVTPTPVIAAGGIGDERARRGARPRSPGCMDGVEVVVEVVADTPAVPGPGSSAPPETVAISSRDCSTAAGRRAGPRARQRPAPGMARPCREPCPRIAPRGRRCDRALVRRRDDRAVRRGPSGSDASGDLEAMANYAGQSPGVSGGRYACRHRPRRRR